MPKKLSTILINILWLFIFGALFGFIFETIYYLIKNGQFINKQGLWYGPFKPVYGFGVLLITITLYKLKDKHPALLFLGGTIVGALFEYIASLFQEYVFGTYTWTYASFNFNLNGRIYLPYCLAWGLISLIFFKFIWPRYQKIFSRVDSKKFRILSIFVALFIIFDLMLTTAITMRYAARAKGIDATNIISTYIDKHYPDEVVKKKMPKLRIVK